MSSSVGIYECEFEFDSSWDGWDKTAIFKGSGASIEVVISDDVARIPWEVLMKHGSLKIGVYGTLGEKIRPTIWSERIPVRLGIHPDSPSIEPTPTIYA